MFSQESSLEIPFSSTDFCTFPSLFSSGSFGFSPWGIRTWTPGDSKIILASLLAQLRITESCGACFLRCNDRGPFTSLRRRKKSRKGLRVITMFPVRRETNRFFAPRRKGKSVFDKKPTYEFSLELLFCSNRRRRLFPRIFEERERKACCGFLSAAKEKSCRKQSALRTKKKYGEWKAKKDEFCGMTWMKSRNRKVLLKVV